MSQQRSRKGRPSVVPPELALWRSGSPSTGSAGLHSVVPPGLGGGSLAEREVTDTISAGPPGLGGERLSEREVAGTISSCPSGTESVPAPPNIALEPCCSRT